MPCLDCGAEECYIPQGRRCQPCHGARQKLLRRMARERLRSRLLPPPPREWRADRSLKELAAKFVSAARRRGLLPDLDGQIACVDCGSRAEIWEHRNYWLPANVEPVCKSCNALRGSAKNEFPAIPMPPVRRAA